MSARRSAGIVLARPAPEGGWQVLVGHMGGPLWARKQAGAWTFPKGEPDESEPLEAAARREFAEELGVPLPNGPWLPLGEVRQSGGKVVTAWAVVADLDVQLVTPGTFEMEWPPRSGVRRTFPELDRVQWMAAEEAQRLVVSAQAQFIDRLLAALSERS